MECPNCHSENKDNARFCSNCARPLSRAAAEAASLTKTLATPLPIISKDDVIAGKYRVIEEIGRGGMGVVYKAEDIKLQRTVALKFLPPHLADSEELKERFLIEARAAAALSHPNICVIHEVGESEERPYIAMEHVEGETLRDRIRKGPVKPEDALGIISQVAAGLGEAHNKGIIHRDVKSANIMVTPKGRAKVMDFGLAKLRGGSSLTKSQTTLGTVAYMSPEQARGDGLDQRTDIWSLGVVLYELLAGKLPFRGDHDQTVIFAILHRKPEPLTRLRPGLAPELDHVVGQALTKKVVDRYKNMEELREDLAAVAEGLKPLRAKARPDQPEKSIAVLPFINDSPDQENTYFINGVMEEILNNLQKIKALRVISRTSVEQYRESKKSVREIAEELGVNYIVEGSAQKYGSAFRLRAQLIMAAKETHLWGESFQRKITDVEDIFSIQTQIAESIAAALNAVISPEEKQLIEKLPTADLPAYDAYLKGKFATYKLAPEDLDAAIQYFEQARERDLGFALPYTGIAMVWIIRQQFGYASPDEAGPKIMEAVGRALELDSTFAEVQYMLANMKVYGMWDWEGGESGYKKTLEINPNHAEAHGAYSMLLIILGRPDEGMEHIKLALKLDPHNPMINLWYSADLLFVQRYDDCISIGRDVLEKNPSIFGVLDQVKDALHLTGRYEEAFEASRLYYSHLYKDLDHVFDQYEKRGYSDTLSLEADALVEQSKLKYVCPNDIATLYIHAGNRERALDCLEQAHESRDSNIIFTGVRSVFANLRDEPRFKELLQKLKLPEANRG